MNKFLKITSVAFLATMALTVTSCGDDNDEPVNGGGNGNVANSQPTTENVFSNGVPASVDGAIITTDENGQVTSIVEGSTTVTFEYGTFTPSRAHNFTVLMKERDSQYPDEGSDIYMELNDKGFVVYAYQVYIEGDDDPDEWTFEYDADGHMTRLTRTESGDDFKITWAEGNVTKVIWDEDDGDHREYSIAYTNSEHTTAVENKGCIMLFDEALHVDMDEMEIAYYAGLLGKATKNLPMKRTVTGVEGGSSYTDTVIFHWELNSNNLPVKFWKDDYTRDAITFAW